MKKLFNCLLLLFFIYCLINKIESKTPCKGLNDEDYSNLKRDVNQLASIEDITNVEVIEFHNRYFEILSKVQNCTNKKLEISLFQLKRDVQVVTELYVLSDIQFDLATTEIVLIRDLLFGTEYYVLFDNVYKATFDYHQLLTSKQISKSEVKKLSKQMEKVIDLLIKTFTKTFKNDPTIDETIAQLEAFKKHFITSDILLSPLGNIAFNNNLKKLNKLLN
eukprot:TRINITY_DN6974_c0_g1_i1.p1 TRINITY_DN6974_c0_g1~~TRINITY_DN6974_c0_g1_i1.p1  ORF type:complete len:220 (+),score=53.38 TRINITY_DN6974_c0_g1_i1:64-723(+)